MTELVHKKVLTLPQMVAKMSAVPAKIVGLEHKGVLAEGYDADITLVDPDQEWVFEENAIASKSKNSPFIGWSLKGRVEATIFGGKIVYQA